MTALVLFLVGCEPFLSTGKTGVMDLSDPAIMFLLGDSSEADLDTEAGFEAVIDELLAFDLAGDTPDALLAQLAIDYPDLRGEMLAVSDECDLFIDEDGTASWTEGAVGTATWAEITTGDGLTAECRMISESMGDECAEGEMQVMIHDGLHAEPTDIDDYLANYLKWDHASATVRAIFEEPTLRAYRFEFTDNSDGPHQFKVYPCIPWQLTYYAGSIEMDGILPDSE